jgi:2-methylcitrate dehydratase PrpD
MGKAFHPGRAAQNGYASALLAEAGFTAGERGIEGPRGFAAVQSAAFDLTEVTADLGIDYNLRRNTYKPFPCGIVNHPTIEACIDIRRQHALAADSIRAVRLTVAPLVLDLCNQQNITKGLQGKFSVYHGAAVGLVRGKAGLQEYTDAAVNDPAVKRVRESATAAGDPSLTEDQARVEVELIDGRVLGASIEQSLGNVHRPLSDAQLDEKFRAQSVLALPAAQVDAALALCWRLAELEDAAELIEAAVPTAASVAPAGR